MAVYRRLAGPMLLAAAALLCMAHTATAATVGPVTDELGVIRIAKGAPIQIGAYWVLSGADTALGVDEKRGVEIAFKDVGGKVLGHPLKLNAEDDGCNAEGGQTAATKLAANPQTVIVLGRPARPPRPRVRRSSGSRASSTSARPAPRPR